MTTAGRKIRHDPRCPCRRMFLRYIGITGAVALLPLAGCTGSDQDADVDPDHGGKGDLWDDPHKTGTFRALVQVLLPRERDVAGALDTNALGALSLSSHLPLVINSGYLPPLPEQLTDHLDVIDELVRDLIVTDLDTAARAKHGLIASFRTLSIPDQIVLVAERFAERTVAPVFELVRLLSLSTFLGAPFNDRGLQAIGLPAYENFADDLCSSGYPDYSPNRIPSWNGKVVWDDSIDGDLP
jgi:hypothetical protein